MRSDPIMVSRRRVGQWASILGSALLLLGILGWLWQGGVSTVVGILLAGGVAGVGLWVLATPGDFVDFVTGRQVRYGTIAAFSSLLLIGIVALVYILTARASLTLDMTLTQSFTLSPETLDVLRNVRRPMQITGFYSADAVQQREIDDQFFRLYETATDGLISRQYINPDEQPALARRFGTYDDGTVYLSYLEEDGSVNFESLMRVPRAGGAQEREMTQAIARMLLSGTLKVYFEVGLGELDPLDDSQQGLSSVHMGMQESGLITDALNLPDLAASGGIIPDDASVVIMTRPGRDLTPDELAVMDDYLQRGGALFIMADVQYTGDKFLTPGGVFDQYLWDNYGMSAYDAALVDEAANLRTPLDVIGAAAFTDTDIGARLNPEEAPTLFRLARPLRLNSDNPPVNNGRVLASSPDSFGETNLQLLSERNEFTYDEGEDIPGPLDIATWAWDLDTGAKILLVGDSDFATNGYVSTALGNAVLFTDGVSWLSGLSEQINFAPQGIAAGLPLIFVSTEQLGLIGFFTIIIMPGLALVLGLAVWTWRARR